MMIASLYIYSILSKVKASGRVSGFLSRSLITVYFKKEDTLSGSGGG
jgi:hypothetical protein